MNVPLVFVAFGVKVAVLPDGRCERSAPSEVIDSPSGSDAATVNEIGLPGLPRTVEGAVTTGARSTLFTVIEVVAVPESALEARNTTV